MLIKEGRFREDLYYRLNVFEFFLPSLKNRPEDIIYYFRKFLKEFSIAYKTKVPKVGQDIIDVLMKYEWPGNIRELKNVAERVSILGEGKEITLDQLPNNIIGITKEKTLSDDYTENKESMLKDFETNFICKYLKLNKGNVAATAKAIHFHPVSLRQKIAKLGIEPKEYKVM